MFPDIIALAIPLLVLSVVIEYLIDRRQQSKQYRLDSTISNMGCGVAEQITGFISKGLFFVGYASLYEHFRLHTFALDSVAGWIALILLVDLIFYGFHVACHRHNILWSGHVVHHEVQEFNLTVALRRSVLQEFLIIPAYLPLALLGFHPAAFFLVFAAHNLYQFLIHSPYFPEMRRLGVLFNTPHHHRVHHCRNRCYIDKNFAGVFIIWDKLFGTFAPLQEAPEFGIHQKTTTFNPVKAQFSTLIRVLKRARQAPTLGGRLRFLWASPAWLAEDGDSGLRWIPKPYRPSVSRRQGRWAAVLFVVATIGVTLYRNFETELDNIGRCLVLLSLGSLLYFLGSLLDGKSLNAGLRDLGGAK
jgi:sterol desaturase/sphingolipid hydroxylase (fatty acid hydroxylase superfamily)